MRFKFEPQFVELFRAVLQIHAMETSSRSSFIDWWIWSMDRLDAMHAHLVRHGAAYIAAMVVYGVFALNYSIDINLSNSLDGKVYLISKNTLPQRGDYVAFRYQGDMIYDKNTRFLKRVVGVPGDTVESKDHQFFVNGQPVGKALPVTSQGLPIEENPFRGVIPAGYFYVQGDHVKSLDSRYKAVGLVTAHDIIGRGYKVF